MKKVLLIEDDSILRENTAELLELSNYEVLTAANGKIGIETAVRELPNIIVCDIMMPEVDGYGVLEALSKNASTNLIPFIFLSAKTERKDIRKGMNLGADDYITKPFSEIELISAIESRLAKVAILRETAAPSTLQKDSNEDELRSLSDLKNFFDDNGEVYEYNEGDMIYSEGRNSNHIYLICKGVVKCYKLDEQGKELTTALFKEDDFIGYSSFTDNIPYQESAMALKNTTVVGIPKNEIKRILQSNHKVALALIELLTDDLLGVKEQLLQMAYSSVNRKTANTILQFAEKLNKKPEDPIRISRTDLASVAGIATETLIRALSSFKKQGIIETEGRNIRIIDLQKLHYIS